MKQSLDETLKVAKNAFSLFQQGLATGKWPPFLDCLTDDARVLVSSRKISREK